MVERIHKSKTFLLVELNGQCCDCFIGIPRSSENTFKRLMKDLGLSQRDNIKVLCVPDDIIND